jgi:hypothetical protein
MTSEEKADQLIRKYTLDFTMDFNISKQAALICVYEIIQNRIDSDLDLDYWQEVKQQIEKL